MSSSRFSVFFVLFPTLFERKYKFFVLSAAYSSNPKVTKMEGERKKDFFITDCANLLHSSTYWIDNNGILSPKLFWPTVRKNCCSDRKKLLKFEAEGREFAKVLRSLEQFVQIVKAQNNFWQQNAFLTCSWRFLISNKLEQL